LSTRRLETECRQLLNALHHADQAWRRACNELAEFETLTDALEEQLAFRDESPVPAPEYVYLPTVSAALSSTVHGWALIIAP
jgi:hypothetical protein